jgi:branched-chain amino acid aminotransferase
MERPVQRPNAATTPAAAPARSSLVWINGELRPAAEATISVFDHGLLYGDGVFEGIRIYGGRIFKLATHLQRLYASAEAIRLDIPYTPEELQQAVRDCVQVNERKDGYIRLCVTRGPGNLGVSPASCSQPQVIIIVDGIALYPPEVYEQGIAVIIASTVRNNPESLSPHIKSMNYLNNILAKMEAIDAGLLEAVMLNHEGFVAECTGDNIFIVRQHEGKTAIITPPNHVGILDGVTRKIVLELAPQLGYQAVEATLLPDDLYQAEEIFLTGTAAEIIAVTKVDDRTIGQGGIGSVVAALTAAYGQLVKQNATED